MLRTLAVVSLVSACAFDPRPPDGAGLPELDFAIDQSGADEASRTVEIAVALSAPADTPISVAYAVGGSAAPERDYTTVADKELTFLPGETQKSVPITIVADEEENETPETVQITLEDPIGATLGAHASHTVTISNVLLPRAQFDISASTTAENTPTVVTVRLDKPAGADASVALAITGGTATPDVDYKITTGTTLVIPAGQLSATAPIGEVDDGIDEAAETVVLALANPSANILVGFIGSSTHSITDDDLPPTVGFALADSSVGEDAGSANLAVTLSAPSSFPITVSYEREGLADSSSTNDATVVGDTLTFAPGETTKSIRVDIVDDNRDEDRESVIVDLKSATNATLAGTRTHALAIDDNDDPPEVSITTASTAILEDATRRTVTVSLSAPSGKRISVPFTVGGTASGPSDYAISGSPLVFDAGTQTRTITIDIDEDADIEADETIEITLGSPQNASPGTSTTYTLTIQNDD